MMEQYSDMMLQEQDYSCLWEQADYLFSDSNASENAKDVSINIPERKAKRRRQKAAAAAQSTTFLNASISNFRALVQQHTGCHNATNKGPITLCFAAAAAAAAPPHHYYHS